MTATRPSRLPAPQDLQTHPSPPPRSRWPWPVQLVVPVVGMAVALALALVVVQGLVLLLDVNPSGPPTGPVDVALAVLPGVLAMVAGIAVAALLARVDGGRRLRDLTGRVSRRRHLVALVLGLVISCVVVLGVGLAVTATGATRPVPEESVGVPVLLALVVGLTQAFALQAIPEELLFRGYLLRSLRFRTGMAVVVSALAFGVIHLASNGGQQGWGERLLYLALPTGFGLTAGALAVATGSVAAAVGIHGGLHLALLTSSLLSGRFPALAVGEGPWVWSSLGLVYALVALVVWVRRPVPSPSGRLDAGAERAAAEPG